MQHLIVQYWNRAILNSETTAIATAASTIRKRGTFNIK